MSSPPSSSNANKLLNAYVRAVLSERPARVTDIHGVCSNLAILSERGHLDRSTVRLGYRRSL